MRSHDQSPEAKSQKYWPSLRKYLVSKISHLSFAKRLIEVTYMPLVIYIS